MDVHGFPIGELMKLDDLAKRADELIKMAQYAIDRKTLSEYGAYIDDGVYHGFRSGSLSFLEATFGANHAYYKEFDKTVISNGVSFISSGQHILQAAKAEIEGGWLFTLKGVVSAEIFGDFIALAKQTLDENKDVAAVLVCAALEDALKRVAIQKGLGVEDKDMSEVINALKANGVIKGAQAPIAKGYAKLRNKAFHAEWDKIEKPEVSSAIGFTEQFLLQHFG